jgi:hypothetical protein
LAAQYVKQHGIPAPPFRTKSTSIDGDGDTARPVSSADLLAASGDNHVNRASEHDSLAHQANHVADPTVVVQPRQHASIAQDVSGGVGASEGVGAYDMDSREAQGTILSQSLNHSDHQLPRILTQVLKSLGLVSPLISSFRVCVCV